MKSEAELQRLYKLERDASSVFTPSRPVQLRALFTGRLRQIDTLLDAIKNPGQHAVIYGEPGVGKTSLAQFVHDNMQVGNVYKHCTKDATMESVFRGIFAQIDISVEVASIGFSVGPASSEKRPLATLLRDVSLTPSVIADTIYCATQQAPLTFFLDEFNRMSPRVRQQFSELLKLLSDTGANCSLVLIGVAHDLPTLIEGHSSVERCISQIYMPRMSDSEVADLVKRGISQIGMLIEPAASEALVRMSRGLPFFTHHLALDAVKVCIRRGDKSVRLSDVQAAAVQLTLKKHSTLGAALDSAVSGQRPDTYKRVLRSAALCRRDEYGYFTLQSVREKLAKTAPDDSKSAQAVIDALCRDGHGRALVTHGKRANRRLRFRDPLFEAYVALEMELEALAHQ